jgi:hypothetical protein
MKFSYSKEKLWHWINFEILEVRYWLKLVYRLHEMTHAIQKIWIIVIPK